jgi:hypothetical protein
MEPLPPAEVLDALDRAAGVLGELDRRQVTLSIHHDAENGEVRVTVQHPGIWDGHELTHTELLDLLDGDARP